MPITIKTGSVKASQQMGADGCFGNSVGKAGGLKDSQGNIIQAQKISDASYPNLTSSNTQGHRTQNDMANDLALSPLRNLIHRQIPPEGHLVDPECFDKMLKECEIYYVDEEDKMELLTAFESYLENFPLDGLKSNVVVETNLKQVATRIFNTLNSVHFKSLDSLKVVQQFFAVTPYSGYVNFNSLKFDPEDKTQYLKVAQAAKDVYEYSDNAFLFLTEYLERLARKMSKEGKDIRAIDQKLEQILKDLKQKHPPNDQIPTNVSSVSIQSLKPQNQSENQKFIDLKKFRPNERNQKVEQFIVDVSKIASNHKQNLVQISQTACLNNNGASYKTGVKVKGAGSKSAIERVKEKLFAKKFTKLGVPAGQTLDEFLENEELAYQKQMAHIIEERDTIVQFTVGDMLRGKCMFKEMPEINSAAEQLIKNCQSNNFKITEIDNRLAKHTTDLVLKVDIKGVITEFQLAFEFNVVKNEYNHKLYQLLRSKCFSVTTMVFRFNEKFKGYIRGLERVMESLNSQGIEVRNNIQRKHIDNIKTLTEELRKMGNMGPQETSFESQKIEATWSRIKQKAERARIEANKKSQQPQLRMHRTAVFYEGLRQKNKAEALLLKIAQQQSTAVGKGDVDADKRIQLLSKLATISKDKGDLDQSLKYREEILEIQQRVKGKKSVGYANTLSDIGMIHKRNGNHAQALKKYKECLEIEEQVLGKDNINIASTFNNIGNVCKDMGKYDQALVNFNRCLSMEEKHYGVGCQQSASTLNNIGVTYRNKQNYDQALKYYKKCLEIEQRTHGKDSIECSSTLNNIGLAYRKKEEFDLALKYYGECLEIQQRVLGIDHIDLASSLNNIGVVYKNKGQLDLALKYYKDCLAIQQRTFGNDHIDCSSTLNNIGMVYKKKKDYAQALKYFEQCLKIETKVYGKDHHETIATRQTVQSTRKLLQSPA